MSNKISAEWTKGPLSQTELTEIGQWKFNRSVDVGTLWLKVSPGGSATVRFRDRTGNAIGDEMVITNDTNGVYVTDAGEHTAFFLFGDVIADVTALSADAILYAEVHA